MSEIKLVLVTGATGFIGAHVVDELLRRGLRVRGTARSKAKAEEMLRARPQFAGQLDFVSVGDLTTRGGFDKAAAGVDAIIHTASPVFYDVKDNEEDLILPAIRGTENILNAAKKSPTVKRFVFTSSFAAIVNIARGAEPGLVYTPEHWNPIEYAQGVAGDAVVAYRVGKKYAERAVWDAVTTENAHFDAVVLCPPMVFGPVVHPVARVQDLNDSNSYLWAVASGAQPFPVARVPLWVDVRDVAFAHAEALLRPEAKNMRFLVAAPENFSYQRAAGIIHDAFDWAKTSVPTDDQGGSVPEWPKGDGSLATKVLGVEYRAFKDTVVDSVALFKEIQLREGQV